MALARPLHRRLPGDLTLSSLAFSCGAALVHLDRSALHFLQ
jgi:hypothetical protein